jgi:hypothetical protein
MQEIEKEEMRREIPEKFRASQDAADIAAFELLQENDRKQKELAERVNAPFASHTPKDRERANALITIRELSEIANYQPLAPAQNEQLAEGYALVGQYGLAKDITLDKAKRAEYEKYHAAVWMDDENWCQHDEISKYIKDYVWSIREGAEMPLLACNECGTWNVKDAPERLLKASSLRAEVRAAYKEMSAPEFERFIEQYKRRI